MHRKLRHRDNSVFVGHVANVAGFDLHHPQCGHCCFSLCKILAHLHLFVIVCLPFENKGAVCSVIQIQNLICHIGQTLNIQHHLKHAVRVFVDDLHLTCAPVRVCTDLVAVCKTVLILFVVDLISVEIFVKQRNQLCLLIQRPFPIGNKRVKILLVVLIKQIFVEQRHKGKPIHRKQRGACKGILRTAVLGRLVESLRPVGLFQINVIKMQNVAVNTVQRCRHGHKACRGTDLIFRMPALDNALDLVNHVLRSDIIPLYIFHPDSQALFHMCLAIKNRINLSIRTFHRNLIIGPAGTVPTQNPELSVLKIQLRKIIQNPVTITLPFRKCGRSDSGHIPVILRLIGRTRNTGNQTQQRK